MTAILKIESKVKHEVELDGPKIAELFWELNSDEQAQFFNKLHDIAPLCALSMQLQYVTDDEALLPSGRSVMKSIGEYSELE